MEQIGRYRILEELGRGAMGIVYKALDPKIGRTIAIKSIPLVDLTDASERQRVRDRLLREAQSAGILSHPNIVTIYDILEQQDMAYIFMEYVNGPSLEKMMRAGTLPAREPLVQLLRQTAAALDYAHQKGIVHRDIKPANLLVAETDSGQGPMAKITDFGVAKFVSQELTHSGSMIGTPNYMSPEQIQGTVVEARSDQFSLAVLVYELLTGVKPFVADSLPALFYLICREPCQPIERVNENLNETVDKVLQRALSKPAAARFLTCSDFIGALGVALGECRNWRPMAAVNMEQTPTSSGLAKVAAAAVAVPVRPSVNPTEPSGASRPASAAVASAPVIAYELPAARRRRLDDEDDDAAHELANQSGSGKKWALIVVLIGLLAVTAAFLKNWKPAPDLPVQVADTKNAPESPPPSDGTVPEPNATQPSASQPSGTQPSASQPSGTQPNASQPSDSQATSSPPSANQSNSTQPNSTEAGGAESQHAPPADEEKSHPEQESGAENAPAARAEVAPQPKPHEQSAEKTPLPKRPAQASSADIGGTSDVDLLSDPAGAKVVVDNNPASACTAPCTLSLPSGRHTLTMNEDGFNTARRVFNVPQDASIYATLSKSTGVLILTSTPTGMNVNVDGRDSGHTPVTLHVPAGRHHIVVTYNGFQQEQTVEVGNDQFIARSFRWSE